MKQRIRRFSGGSRYRFNVPVLDRDFEFKGKFNLKVYPDGSYTLIQKYT